MGTNTSNIQLSDRLNALEESATIAMASKARELQSKGVKVIKLSLGEPDFATPEHIQEAAKEAIDSGEYFGYPPVPGYPELRQGIANKLKRDNGLDYKPENIIVSTGAKQSIANLLLSTINKGDEVLIFTPYWVTYIEQVKLAEGTPVLVEGSIENDFKVTPDQLRKAITSKTKAIMYSSPCNPTGTVFTKEELEGFAEVLKEHPQVLVISDEIYEYINFGGKHVSMASIEGMKDRTIIINGLAKGFAMTGWRIGYLAAPLEIAKACNKMQGQITSATCSIAQRAAIAAVNGSLEPTFAMRDAYLRRRGLVKERLDQIEGVKTNLPEGAFYIFPDVSAYFGKKYQGEVIKDSDDLAMYLLNVAHVAVVAGSGFGAPKCIRISFAASDEDLIKACDKIKEALGNLQ